MQRVRLMNSPAQTNLLGLPRPELEAFVAQLGSKPFRARQLMNWMYKRGEGSFENMTDLAKDFRVQLAERAAIRTPEIVSLHKSADDTCKWVLRADSSQAFEMVFIPEPDRGTLCISSQVGCALDCSFCSTAQQGFNRNLTTAEIVGQVWLAKRELAEFGESRQPVGDHRIVTNVVLMGMGEPLANFRNVVPALRILLDDYGFDLSRRRVTLSTSGLVPQMRRLAEEGLQIGLAISLHAPNDELRSSLMPVNRRWPIAEVLDAAEYYVKRTGRRVSFEYTLMAGVNDSDALADDLARLLRGRLCHVNLIPLNPNEDTSLHASSTQRALAFEARLRQAGVAATIRVNRGRDILAACGQLRLAEKKQRERQAVPA